MGSFFVFSIIINLMITIKELITYTILVVINDFVFILWLTFVYINENY